MYVSIYEKCIYFYLFSIFVISYLTSFSVVTSASTQLSGDEIKLQAGTWMYHKVGYLKEVVVDNKGKSNYTTQFESREQVVTEESIYGALYYSDCHSNTRRLQLNNSRGHSLASQRSLFDRFDVEKIDNNHYVARLLNDRSNVAEHIIKLSEQSQFNQGKVLIDSHDLGRVMIEDGVCFNTLRSKNYVRTGSSYIRFKSGFSVKGDRYLVDFFYCGSDLVQEGHYQAVYKSGKSEFMSAIDSCSAMVESEQHVTTYDHYYNKFTVRLYKIVMQDSYSGYIVPMFDNESLFGKVVVDQADDMKFKGLIELSSDSGIQFHIDVNVSIDG